MILQVMVKPAQKENMVKQEGENQFAISVKARAEAGEANLAVIKLLAKHFHISSSRIRIQSGFSSRKKRIEVLGQ